MTPPLDGRRDMAAIRMTTAGGPQPTLRLMASAVCHFS
jgi:hypothetical protein